MRVTVQNQSAVALITLDNGPLNLMSSALRRELQDVAVGVAADKNINAVVIQGGARAFSAGSDINEFPSNDAEARDFSKRELECIRAIRSIPQPVVAALHGYVLGGGLEVALACDLRVAASDAVFALPEVSLGLFAGDCTVSLGRLIGAPRAKSMLLSGKRIPASKAENWGLVDEVTEPEEATQTALEWARAVARYPSRVVRAIKAFVDESTTPNGDIDGPHYQVESTMAAFLASREGQEGVRAFLEKRTPSF